LQILKKENAGRMVKEAENLQFNTENFQIPQDG
jgi:hypothetical protein